MSALTPRRDETTVAVPHYSMTQVAQVATATAAQTVFFDYLRRRPQNTQAAKRLDLALFARFLASRQIVVQGDLLTDPTAWHGMTWGLLQHFVDWLLQTGYAVASINRALSTVRVHSDLAAKAGIIPAAEVALLHLVHQIARRDVANVDATRALTRRGAKYVDPPLVAVVAADQMKHAQPPTAWGRQNAALACLLFDHGLRRSEVLLLEQQRIDLTTGLMEFFRPKVQQWTQHRLTEATLAALRAYCAGPIGPVPGCFWPGITPGGAYVMSPASPVPVSVPLSPMGLLRRVHTIGRAAGIPALFPHACRHFWAMNAIANGTSYFDLMKGGGWVGGMPERYARLFTIANDGVKLGARERR